MDYAGLYQKKLTSAEEAVKVVKSGDWVDYGWCTNHPYTLDKALAARQSELKDIKVRGGVTMWMPEICKAEGTLAVSGLIKKSPEGIIRKRRSRQYARALIKRTEEKHCLSWRLDRERQGR